MKNRKIMYTYLLLIEEVDLLRPRSVICTYNVSMYTKDIYRLSINYNILMTYFKERN
jgi:hypothetical protein